MDSPFDYYQGPGLPLWHPENYGDEDFGPTPLRVGIEKSQNVMTVRIANAIGMPIVVEYAKKFGIVDDMPNFLAYALGTKETTPLRMAAAYGMIVNGGKKITPSLIDRVQDRDGKTIWRADNRDCKDCASAGWSPQMLPPDLPDMREQIEDPRTTYQMVNILTGVVQRGTAARLHDIDFPLAGKTGTTNDSKDAWFVGFTPDLVCARLCRVRQSGAARLERNRRIRRGADFPFFYHAGDQGQGARPVPRAAGPAHGARQSAYRRIGGSGRQGRDLGILHSRHRTAGRADTPHSRRQRDRFRQHGRRRRIARRRYRRGGRRICAGNDVGTHYTRRKRRFPHNAALEATPAPATPPAITGTGGLY